jgi:PhnB protein
MGVEINMTQLNAYLHFDGNCAEAMKFYKECLGGELSMQTIGESQMAAQMPPQAHKQIIHSTLTKGNLILMASDMFEGKPETGNMMSLCLVSDNLEELKSWFAKLSAGGKVGHDLKVEFFGTFGDLTDKFGVDWMFQSDQKAG